MKRALLLLVLVTVVGLAGCIGSEDADVDPASELNASVSLPNCEHPWPCADGSEWPTNLTAPDEQPRQPPVIPDTVSIEDGEVVERNEENVTFAWDVATPDTASRILDDGDTQSTQVTTVTAPSGLFLEWSIEVEVEDPGRLDAREVRVALEDEDGETVCRAITDAITLLDPGDRASCTGTVAPLDRPANWSLTATYEGVEEETSSVDVTLTARVVEPQLTIGLERMEHVYVESHDGTELEGWIFHPDLPEGVEAPVVLHATPYIGICSLGQNHPVATYGGCYGVPEERWADTHRYYAPLVSNGYAVAAFSVRGTGGSEGCFGQHSLEEQRDYAHLVDWLGEQDWSNGRVGMMGLSYHGTTPFSAAIHQSEHLKTIVTAGIITDWYTFYVTPQGATHPYWGWREAKFDAQNSLTRPAAAALADGDPGYAPVLAERACTGHAEHSLAQSSWVATDQRPEAYFDERRLIDRFDNITASVFVSQGLLDNGGHAFQEDSVWGTLENPPKRMLLGQWGHTFPRHDGMLDGSPIGQGWNQDVLIPWMDFWLKGLGDPADLRLGTVDYEDTSGDWHVSESWPPAEQAKRALHLSGDSLAEDPGSETASFRVIGQGPARCDGQEANNVATFVSEPLDQRAVLAGNPFGYLTLEASQDGGAFDVYLVKASSDVDVCQALVDGSDEVDLVSRGAVDLHYHEGNFEGRDFPSDEPTPVRVDLHNQAWVLEPGQRLALVLVGNEILTWSSRTPELTVHPDSHLVLPIVEGDLGGDLPDVDYPPRPFVPSPSDGGWGR